MGQMTANPSSPANTKSVTSRLVGTIAVVGIIAFVIFDGPGAIIHWFSSPALTESQPEQPTPPDTYSLTQAQVDTAGIRTEPAPLETWVDTIRVTGALALNEDRVAHIHPVSGGVVRGVDVKFGEQVSSGQLLATIDSPEVGTAKLNLVQSQLKLKAAQTKLDWTLTINTNVQQFIEELGANDSPIKLLDGFRDKPMGDYRQQIVGALTRRRLAEADVARLSSLAAEIVASKELLKANAELEAAKASLQSQVEQIKFDSQQQLLVAQQQVEEAKTSLGVSRSRLYVLGYTPEQVDAMDPLTEGPKLAYFSIKSPLDGTIVEKDIVLDEHVDPSFLLFKIADLSTVWLKASVFERDLGSIRALVGREVNFKAAGYPKEMFTAKVVSMGNVVDELTRAVPLLAVAQNKDRLLKPGMYVEVDLPASDPSEVIQLPASAIVEDAGTTYVFVQESPTTFRRMRVVVGRKHGDVVEIVSGVKQGDPVVVSGTIALKSEMLRELMSEE